MVLRRLDKRAGFPKTPQNLVNKIFKTTRSVYIGFLKTVLNAHYQNIIHRRIKTSDQIEKKIYKIKSSLFKHITRKIRSRDSNYYYYGKWDLGRGTPLEITLKMNREKDGWVLWIENPFGIEVGGDDIDVDQLEHYPELLIDLVNENLNKFLEEYVDLSFNNTLMFKERFKSLWDYLNQFKSKNINRLPFKYKIYLSDEDLKGIPKNISNSLRKKNPLRIEVRNGMKFAGSYDSSEHKLELNLSPIRLTPQLTIPLIKETLNFLQDTIEHECTHMLQGSGEPYALPDKRPYYSELEPEQDFKQDSKQEPETLEDYYTDNAEFYPWVKDMVTYIERISQDWTKEERYLFIRESLTKSKLESLSNPNWESRLDSGDFREFLTVLRENNPVLYKKAVKLIFVYFKRKNLI